MPRLQLTDGPPISHESTGDGFPLILLPGPEGVAAWSPHMPLLGEICHTIAYEFCRPQPAGCQSATAYLPALLDALCLERFYLASPAPAWLPALQFARRHPEALEALLLVDLPDPAAEAPLPDHTLATHLPGMALPTRILLSHDASPARPVADCLSTHLPHCRTLTMGRLGQGQPDLPKAPRRQLSHLMMQFLLDRERHRNLVRGASFLL